MIFKQLAMAAILFFKMRLKFCTDRFLHRHLEKSYLGYISETVRYRNFILGGEIG